MFFRCGKIIIVNLQVFSPSAQVHFQTCSILLIIIIMQVKGGRKLFVSKSLVLLTWIQQNVSYCLQAGDFFCFFLVLRMAFVIFYVNLLYL